VLEAETGPSQAAAPAGTGGVSYVAPTPPMGASPPPAPLSAPELSPEPVPAPQVSPPSAPPAPETPRPSQFGVTPPTQPAKGEKIIPRGSAQSVGYFLFGASLAAIVASLGLMALKAQRTVAVSQAQASYETDIKARLNDKVFKDQEEKVQAIGNQVNLLKQSLADRVMFSKFLAELEGATYKKARFSAISANSDSAVTLSGEVADFYDLSKTITALKASKNFQKIELTSVEIDPEKKTVIFGIQIQLNASLLKPVSSAKSTPTGSAAEDAASVAGDTVSGESVTETSTAVDPAAIP